MRKRLIIALLSMLSAAPAPAYDVRIEGDRLTLDAQRVPLQDVLRSFAHAGVRVSVDPRIDLLVTGSCEAQEMESALDELLKDVAYVLVWEMIQGPVGDYPRLAEMQVFLPGQKEKTKPLEPPQRNLRVTRGPTGQGPEFVEDEILIGMKPGTSVEAFRTLLAQIGGTIVGSVPGLGIYQVRLPRGTNILALLEQLKNNPIVSAAEPNYATRLPPAVADKDKTPGGLSAAPYPAGAARVAVLDSGLLPKSGIDANIVATYDALMPGSSLEDPAGHGTQMAMIASGAIDPTGTGSGDAEGVPVVAIRTFDDNGVTSNYALMRAIDYAISQGARVVNLSWGSETSSEFVESSINYAQSKGVVVVAAAGNTPSGQPYYPAAYPGVVSVSAVDASGDIWKNSNYGSTITVSAPGTATFPVGHQGPPGAYAGTSISSAYVSRELALYLTKNPKATPQDVRNTLTSSVTDTGTPGKDPYYGYGTLDAAAVMNLQK